jgi:type II secretory pathway pseudopilin PulG
VTLVELLASLTIITILASLSLAGMAGARARAKAAKTSATIRKISEIILPYYEQYETRRPSVLPISSLTPNRSDLAAAKQLAIRRLMTLELPERPNDVSAIGASNYSSAISGSGSTFSFPDVPPTARRYQSLLANGAATSAELLHMIVTRGPVADPDIIAHFRDDEMADTDPPNGLLEFVDGWRRPIMFKRWPTGFQSPMQPIDGTARNIESLVSDRGHRLVPLIYSAGPDGSYDIEAQGDLVYATCGFDPFSPSTQISCDSQTVSGSVVLAPENLNPLTFRAQRIASPGSWGVISGAFQAVGSERDTGSADGASPDGILQSRDNIHNHDMTR